MLIASQSCEWRLEGADRRWFLVVLGRPNIPIFLVTDYYILTHYCTLLFQVPNSDLTPKPERPSVTVN